ncbi:MAG: class I SAM-dependent methyltransferase [Cyanobacteria bacterium TGS_CYA1]|nr:class I SAM-dependent methyltransferase [Cyanobacteria bacterium TGS_CYA1]
MTENAKKLETILSEHFEPLINKHGNNHEAVNWGSQYSQRLRFEVLLEPFLSLNKRVSILDVGCGIGHMLDFLIESEIEFDYHGIDAVERMIDQARLNHPIYKNLFENSSLESVEINKHDVVVASGIFFLACDKERMKELITRLFSLCKIGIAFNSLSKLAVETEPNEFYADPAEVLDFCLKITPWCRVRHDYLPNDFTVHMFREIV